LPVGDYELRAEISGGNASVSHVFTLHVVDFSPEVIDADPPGPTGVSHMISLSIGVNARDHEGVPLRYQWTLDGNRLAASANQTTLSPLGTGNHQVEVVVSDGSSSTAWIWAVESTDAPPVILAQSPAKETLNLSTGETGFFSVVAVDSDGEAIVLKWFRDGRAWGEGDNITTSWSSPGSFTVSVHVYTPGHSVVVSWVVAVATSSPETAISAAWPLDPLVQLFEGERETFVVILSPGAAQTAQVEWILDGERIGQGFSYTLDASNAGPGTHRLTATVHLGVDQETMRNWTVTVETHEQPVGRESQGVPMILLGAVLGAAVAGVVLTVLARTRDRRS
jgi:hypothetical protein